MASNIVINISGDFTPAQVEAVMAIGPVLREFLLSPNETAIVKNNELQKLCGLARKAIVGETNPKKKGKK